MAWAEWDQRRRVWVIVEHFDPEEAENIAGALGPYDQGGQHLREVAQEVREINRSLEDDGEGADHEG